MLFWDQAWLSISSSNSILTCTPQILTKHLLCARHYSKCWGYSREKKLLSLVSSEPNLNNFCLQDCPEDYVGLEDHTLNVFDMVQLKIEKDPSWIILTTIPLSSLQYGRCIVAPAFASSKATPWSIILLRSQSSCWWEKVQSFFLGDLVLSSSFWNLMWAGHKGNSDF